MGRVVRWLLGVLGSENYAGLFQVVDGSRLVQNNACSKEHGLMLF